ncbi:MAG: hypothetical protein HC782_04135 [Gammaproteobacteria bacterium]|nr:hypothetical protein [Gammaproteobacteria bacterium]
MRVFAKFSKSAREWVGIVGDCEEGFLEEHDYVEHLIYCREVIENEVRANPALVDTADWQLVLTADAAFSEKNSVAMPALNARYAAWWQRVGWSIFARVNRQFDESAAGIAQHEKTARVKAAYARSLKTDDVIASNENTETLDAQGTRKAAGRGGAND